MKWIRKILDLFKKKKSDNIQEQVPIEQKTVQKLEAYTPQDLTQIEDKTSYEYMVAEIRNEAKSLFELNHYKEMSAKLWEMSEQAERTLLVLIMGEFKTGKSTFINALLGDEILKSDITPATAVVTMLSYGEEKKVIVHFKDGTDVDYSVEELAQLTAEGDEEKAKLRDTIKYVELFLPQPLLKQVTLVDTPGLNVDNNKHIQATQDFMNQADLVLWVFAAGKAASRTEIAAIKDLSERLKPIAIVNRIDEIDEEEETIEEVLEEIGARLKNTVEEIIGLSAFQAKKGQLENEENLLKESNWHCFKKKFDHDVLSKSEELKVKATVSKLSEFLKTLDEDVKAHNKKLKELDEKVNNREQFIKDSKDSIAELENVLKNLKNIPVINHKLRLIQ